MCRVCYVPSWLCAELSHYPVAKLAGIKKIFVVVDYLDQMSNDNEYVNLPVCASFTSSSNKLRLCFTKENDIFVSAFGNLFTCPCCFRFVSLKYKSYVLFYGQVTCFTDQS